MLRRSCAMGAATEILMCSTANGGRCDGCCSGSLDALNAWWRMAQWIAWWTALGVMVEEEGDVVSMAFRVRAPYPAFNFLFLYSVFGALQNKIESNLFFFFEKPQNDAILRWVSPKTKTTQPLKSVRFVRFSSFWVVLNGYLLVFKKQFLKLCLN